VGRKQIKIRIFQSRWAQHRIA